MFELLLTRDCLGGTLFRRHLLGHGQLCRRPRGYGRHLCRGGRGLGIADNHINGSLSVGVDRTGSIRIRIRIEGQTVDGAEVALGGAGGREGVAHRRLNGRRVVGRRLQAIAQCAQRRFGAAFGRGDVRRRKRDVELGRRQVGGENDFAVLETVNRGDHPGNRAVSFDRRGNCRSDGGQRGRAAGNGHGHGMGRVVVGDIRNGEIEGGIGDDRRSDFQHERLRGLGDDGVEIGDDGVERRRHGGPGGLRIGVAVAGACPVGQGVDGIGDGRACRAGGRARRGKRACYVAVGRGQGSLERAGRGQGGRRGGHRFLRFRQRPDCRVLRVRRRQVSFRVGLECFLSGGVEGRLVGRRLGRDQRLTGRGGQFDLALRAFGGFHRRVGVAFGGLDGGNPPVDGINGFGNQSRRHVGGVRIGPDGVGRSLQTHRQGVRLIGEGIVRRRNSDTEFGCEIADFIERRLCRPGGEGLHGGDDRGQRAVMVDFQTVGGPDHDGERRVGVGAGGRNLGVQEGLFDDGCDRLGVQRVVGRRRVRDAVVAVAVVVDEPGRRHEGGAGHLSGQRDDARPAGRRRDRRSIVRVDVGDQLIADGIRSVAVEDGITVRRPVDGDGVGIPLVTDVEGVDGNGFHLGDGVGRGVASRRVGRQGGIVGIDGNLGLVGRHLGVGGFGGGDESLGVRLFGRRRRQIVGALQVGGGRGDGGDVVDGGVVVVGNKDAGVEAGPGGVGSEGQLVGDGRCRRRHGGTDIRILIDQIDQRVADVLDAVTALNRIADRRTVDGNGIGMSGGDGIFQQHGVDLGHFRRAAEVGRGRRHGCRRVGNIGAVDGVRRRGVGDAFGQRRQGQFAGFVAGGRQNRIPGAAAGIGIDGIDQLAANAVDTDGVGDILGGNDILDQIAIDGDLIGVARLDGAADGNGVDLGDTTGRGRRCLRRVGGFLGFLAGLDRVRRVGQFTAGVGGETGRRRR